MTLTILLFYSRTVSRERWYPLSQALSSVPGVVSTLYDVLFLSRDYYGTLKNLKETSVKEGTYKNNIISSYYEVKRT